MIGIIAVLMVLIVPALTSRKTAGDITNAASAVAEALERARTFAIANNTYSWIGFFEEDVTSTATPHPRAAGVGRIVISIVASKDGTRYKDSNVDTSNPHAFYPPPAPSPLAATDTNAAVLTQVGKLTRIENSHLAQLASAVPARATVGSDYQLAATEFTLHPSTPTGNPPTAGPPVTNPTTFNYPLSASSTTADYTFTRIIEFNPRGEALKIVDLPTPLMEIGLRPTHGNVVDNNSANIVAIQLTGGTGKARSYRP